MRNLAKTKPNKNKEKEKDNDKYQLIYYKYKKPGYCRSDCPTLKKPFKKNNKKKAMITTQSDSEYTSSNKKEEGKIINLCLMTLEDEINSEPNLEFTFDELYIALYDLFVEF